MATISDAADARRPPAWALMREGAALLARFYRAFGSLEERGPADGPQADADPRLHGHRPHHLGLAARAGRGRLPRHRLGPRPQHAASGRRRSTASSSGSSAFGGGKPVILVGWSLGGVFAREVGQAAPRPGREGDHHGFALLGRSAQQQCLASLRIDCRPPGRRSADRRGAGGKAAGADARSLVAPRRHRRRRRGARRARRVRPRSSSSTAATWASPSAAAPIRR